jgi:hypothetical protein
MRGLRLCASATLLICVGCTSGAPPPKVEGAAPATRAIPQSVTSKCADVTTLTAACPTRMPKVIDEDHRARAFRTGPSSVFFAEWSAPYPGLTARNAPPRFVHINVIASPLHQPLAFEWPVRPTTGLEGLPKAPRKRNEPLLVGTYTWAGRDGEVALAPSFPAGGIEGDHLIFRWIEADIAYSISLHAWKPLDATLETLEAVVGSIPVQSKP